MSLSTLLAAPEINAGKMFCANDLFQNNLIPPCYLLSIYVYMSHKDACHLALYIVARNRIFCNLLSKCIEPSQEVSHEFTLNYHQSHHFDS